MARPVQNIFSAILANQTVFETCKERYDLLDLKRMYKLEDDEARELYYFIQNTEMAEDGQWR